MNYYVIKVTIENNQEIEQIRPFNNYRQALIDYHNVIGGTIVYDTVLVCTCMLIDEYGKVLKSERYEKEKENQDPDPGI